MMDDNVFCEMMKSIGSKRLILTYETGETLVIRKSVDRYCVSNGGLFAHGHFDGNVEDGGVILTEGSGRPAVSFSIKSVKEVKWEE